MKENCRMLAEKEENLRKSLKNIALAMAIAIGSVGGGFGNAWAVTNCKEAEIIFARGSGQKLGDRDAVALKNALQKQLIGNGISYRFYELGESEQAGAKYPATGLNIINVIGTLISRGEANRFGESVETGAKEMAEHVKQLSQNCPETKLILTGYSQGAKVIEKALPKIKNAKIALVLTFGDPNLFLPEGKGKNPPACQGKELSSYREFAPDCRTEKGILGARSPYEVSPAIGKFKIWCNENDLICGARANFINPMAGHSNYVKNRRYEQAAKVILKALKPGSEAVGKEMPEPLVQNTAIVIDSTLSMKPKIQRYKKEALQLAEESIKNGGKIALFEYKDIFADKFKTKMRCDFSCSLEKFKIELEDIRVKGGGDEPESALPAMMDALEKLQWQQGANKSIVLLTDASYFNPSKTGIRTRDILQKSLEIDPVNIYVIAPKRLEPFYRELVMGSSGKFFAIEDENKLKLSTEYLLSRPMAVLPLAEYRTQPGETIVFDASKSAAENGVMEFWWDLDGDGEFEAKTDGPIARKKYLEEQNDFVQVKVIDRRGFESTMSARLIVEKPENTARITKIVSENTGEKIKIRFESEFADEVILVIDEAIMGRIQGNEFKVGELGEKDLNIKLVPFNKDGERGEAGEINLRFNKETREYDKNEIILETSELNSSQEGNKKLNNKAEASKENSGNDHGTDKTSSQDLLKTIPVPSTGSTDEKERNLRAPDTGEVK